MHYVQQRPPMTTIPFSGSQLDRASDRRTDARWLEEQLHDPDSLVWPFWQLRPLIRSGSGSEAGKSPSYLTVEAARQITDPNGPLIFLGLDNGRAIFALDIVTETNPTDKRLLAGIGEFCEARAAAQMLSLESAAVLGQAKALIDWHKRHRFCPNCGAETFLADGGYRRHCVACGADHFPRTDPVVIMLAIHGDACLVGRSQRFAKGMFSALAGFIEPGETIEEAVVREVFEETRVRVHNVTYFAAQPWPFPSSLMIGCFAEAEARELMIDTNELAEAFWLEKAKLRALFSGQPVNGLTVPPPIAIAHHLLKRFAEMP
jgi:NAD+ diphosphatase